MNKYEEVCNALSEYFKEKVKYDSNKSFATHNDSIARLYNKKVWIQEYLPPYLITMIGQFYESELNKQ